MRRSGGAAVWCGSAVCISVDMACPGMVVVSSGMTFCDVVCVAMLCCAVLCCAVLCCAAWLLAWHGVAGCGVVPCMFWNACCGVVSAASAQCAVLSRLRCVALSSCVTRRLYGVVVACWRCGVVQSDAVCTVVCYGLLPCAVFVLILMAPCGERACAVHAVLCGHVVRRGGCGTVWRAAS